jgi:hypothetical protein
MKIIFQYNMITVKMQKEDDDDDDDDRLSVVY